MKEDWEVRPFRRQAGAEKFLSPFSAAESPGFQIPSPAAHADHLQVGWGGLLQPLNQLASVTWLREQSQALDKGNIRALWRSAPAMSRMAIRKCWDSLPSALLHLRPSLWTHIHAMSHGPNTSSSGTPCPCPHFSILMAPSSVPHSTSVPLY